MSKHGRYVFQAKIESFPIFSIFFNTLFFQNKNNSVTYVLPCLTIP